MFAQVDWIRPFHMLRTFLSKHSALPSSYQEITGLPHSPIRNRANIICQYISSKSVELEKYMRLQETIESMFMSVRVNFRPSWSSTVAERMPPSGHTSVLMDAMEWERRHSKLLSRNFWGAWRDDEEFILFASYLCTLYVALIKQTHRTSSPDRHLISADYCRPLVLRALWLGNPSPCHSTALRRSPEDCRQSCRGEIKGTR